MKQIINRIFNKPIKNSEPEPNKIEFLVDSNNNPYIKISILNTDSSDAKNFADLIFNIVGGSYVDSIIKTMLDLSKEDDTIKTFVTQTLIQYSLLNSQYLSNVLNSTTTNSPIVKPSEFIKYHGQ